MTAILRIKAPQDGLQYDAAGATESPVKSYIDRVVKLVPAEVVSAYLAGKAGIEAAFPEGMAARDGLISEHAYWLGWTLFCLVAVVAVRAWATSDRKAGVKPEWAAVGIAAVSFLIWVYSMGDVFAQPGLFSDHERGIWEPLLSTMLVLAWTLVVPIFYRGDSGHAATPTPQQDATSEDAMSTDPNGFLVGGTEDTTWIRPLGQQWKQVTYTRVDDLAVFEGCVILGTVAEMQAVRQFVANNPGVTAPGVEAFGVGIVGVQYRWESDTIPYQVDPALQRPERVRDAIAHWEANTPIRFVRRDSANPAHRDYVVFRPGGGCASNVGRRGGRQEIVLGPGCSTGNCIHEIGHTVGLWHEQSRADREQFVTINWQNILDSARHNFNQHIQDGVDLGTYDYESIMHYPPDAFSGNGQPTIVPKQAGAQIGQRAKLSAGDIAAVRKLITI